MKAVIMAGGKGTRISSIASDIPKPMIRIGDKPVLQLEIESLKKQGFKDFIITVINNKALTDSRVKLTQDTELQISSLTIE